MTEIAPFRGLRYDPERVSGSDVIAPPYDVVTPDDVAALLGQSPFNVAHIESAPGPTDARYDVAAELLKTWEADGVLRRDSQPVYYAYEQRFAVPTLGNTLARRVFFARLQLSPREAGNVRPHEATLSAAKDDRLKLLRATHTNVSPIFGMFSDAHGTVAGILSAVVHEQPAFEARDGRGDEHRLWIISNSEQIEALTRAVAASPVTIADGHHRYETALNFMREREAAEGAADAERSVLAGLVAQEDSGLVVLPIHRLIKNEAIPADFDERLAALYAVEDCGAMSAAASSVEGLWQRVRAATPDVPTFGVLGLTPGRMHLLVGRTPEVTNAMPSHFSPASRGLDVLVLNETILAPLLGLNAAARAAGENIAFTEDVHEAWRAVDSGAYRLAFLVSPVRVGEIVAVADAGELLPQKSTFFYPKLATGMVLNPLD